MRSQPGENLGVECVLITVKEEYIK